MSKFDGPQFINPSHTSFGQALGTYQNPVDYKIKQVTNARDINLVKRKPGSDWCEEEISEIKKFKYSQEKPIAENYKSFKSCDEIPNKNACFEYENKIIDDLLNFQGISTKPSEGLMSEFLKKSKTLNKLKISNILLEKLRDLINLCDKNSMIKIMKGLYIVEALLQKQYDNYHELFKCKIDLIHNLANQFSDKKVNDLAKVVLKLLGSNEFDELELKTYKPNLTNEQPKREFSFIKTKNNFTKNNNKEDQIQVDQDIVRLIDLNQQNKISQVEEENKFFSFIKFAKSDQIVNSSNPLLLSQINDIFSSQDNSNEQRSKKIQSNNLLNLDELYAERSDLKKNNIGNLTNYSINYHQNYNIELSDLTALPFTKEEKNVQIERLAGCITNENKESISKTNVDHFNFVKELMKKKL